MTDFENLFYTILIFFIMWVLAAALYTRVSKKSNLLKTTVGI